MHLTQSKLKKILWPFIMLCEMWGRISPVSIVKLRYYARFHRFPNLRNPKDLNEKILWLKLYSDTSKWVNLADKFKVRHYIESIGLSEILIPLIGVWDKAEEIKFDTLPKKLIFKGTHDHTLVINNLDTVDQAGLVKTLNSWLSNKLTGAIAGEPHYRFIERRIIAEELLPIPDGAKSVVDYKIWCLNGKAFYVWACSNRVGVHTEVMTYDRDWNAHPEFSIFTDGYRHGELLPRPKNLEKMLGIAETLSKGFPILRVDLYNIDGKIYFGELTFTSLGGMMDFYTQDFLDMVGAEADISKVKKVK